MKKKILIDIGHPAHVHLFKNLVINNRQRYHFTVVSRSKDVTESLLNHYRITHMNLSQVSRSISGNSLELVKRDWEIWRLHHQRHFDLALGTSVSIAHLSAVSRLKSLVFNEDDDDIVPLFANITYPFATRIVCPDCLRSDRWLNKRVIHNSYHELAYLHPNNFAPDRHVPAKYGFKPYSYVIVRNSALAAHHDHGVKGLSGEVWDRVYELIKDCPQVFSREGKASGPIKPWDMHHLLAYAKLVISDSQTMTAEAAVLGVPSVRYNSFVGRISYLEELEHRYGLTFGFRPGREKAMLKKIQKLLSASDLRPVWISRKRKMLADKIDLNEWLQRLVEDNL